ncbi:MAG: type II toxin-antitoxin system MqsR family toxin [Acidobacteria bacterium]|nr:type II toxin-antitoxin system MqsR family toxin [Acidobacteriota bacterium]
MEKRSPHCALGVVKALVAAGKVRATVSALAGGAALGFSFEEIVDVVVALTPRDFYKSMTTHADHRIWQDVYRPKTAAGEVYIKLTVIDDVLIVSFKAL